MSEASFFTDMLQSITDRGRQLLFSGPRATQVAAKVDLQTLCEMLLSSRGEASGMALAAEILDRWGALDSEELRRRWWSRPTRRRKPLVRCNWS